MRVEVYDLECMVNLFTYTGYNRTEDKWYRFVIHKLRNDYKALVSHVLSGDLVMVGFNNLNYDYPLLHHLLNHYEDYKNLSGEELTRKFYEKSQEIIESDFSVISEKNTKVPQIDVFKIHHWDNPAKACSLKHCEMAMRMHNIEEMPLHHTYWVTSLDEIQMILNYNEHDVKATNIVFDYTLGNTDHVVYKGRNKLALRQLLSKTFGINLLNHNDVKIGEDLVLELYSRNSGIPLYTLKKLRTQRPIIYLKDCIPSYIKFETSAFQQLLDDWKSKSITTTKKAISDKIVFHGISIGYGTGGIHGSNSGIFISDDDYIIIDSDVGSLYPSIIVNNGYYPKHLGPLFLQLYKYFVDTRLEEKKKPKKQRDAVIMEGYKLMVNGLYGKFNSETSPFYDPLVAMSTTITGQLSLSMLMEMLTLRIPKIEWIQCNTDGITARVPRSEEHLYYEVCKEWENITKLVLEHALYKKMVVRDVSNYLAIFDKVVDIKDGEISYYPMDDIKLKGEFEIDTELHKDPGSRIIPIALKEYFVNGVPIEKTIREHNDVLDFCLELKGNRDWNPVHKYLEDGVIKEEALGRINRYFVSGLTGAIGRGNKTDGRSEQKHRSYGIKVFNRFYENSMKDYNLNYNFYIVETNKIINKIEDRQLKLF